MTFLVICGAGFVLGLILFAIGFARFGRARPGQMPAFAVIGIFTAQISGVLAVGYLIVLAARKWLL